MRGKIGVTPSVAAPGDTNPSDATVWHAYTQLANKRRALFTRRRVVDLTVSERTNVHNPRRQRSCILRPMERRALTTKALAAGDETLVLESTIWRRPHLTALVEHRLSTTTTTSASAFSRRLYTTQLSLGAVFSAQKNPNHHIFMHNLNYNLCLYCLP